MTFRILALPGDGIGPEVVASARKVMNALALKSGWRFSWQEALIGGAAIEAFGKSAVVGLDGEIEHASGLIHTLRFGNVFRRATGAKSYLAFANTRGPANAPIIAPLMDKNDAGRRSHYMTVQFAIPDAPRADEIVVVLAGATGGRPHHRIGDRHRDLRELGHDLDNPAAV